MATEDKEGGGGLTISLAAVANTVAALALVGICGTLWTDHSSLISALDSNAQLKIDVARDEGEIRGLRADVNTLVGASQEMKDVKINRDAQIADIFRRFERDEKVMSDLDLLMRPPRNR